MDGVHRRDPQLTMAAYIAGCATCFVVGLIGGWFQCWIRMMRP
jgi:hypothetical protein